MLQQNGTGFVPVPHIKEYANVQWRDNPLAPAGSSRFRGMDEHVLANIVRGESTRRLVSGAVAPALPVETAFLRSGAREQICFEPSKVKAAVVTCGGLCPGLNSVIREIVCNLHRIYGGGEVWGIQYGFEGFYSKESPPVLLDLQAVRNLHQLGGTILGSSRGGFQLDQIVGGILSRNFNQLYIVGGDGTHRGAQAVYQEIRKRQLPISVIGIPKTIDNDLSLIDRSFGFDTAVEEAEKALRCADVEASCAVNGVCIVQVMGRLSGFVAGQATLASRSVDVCLVPEVHFDLNAMINYVAELLRKQGKVVICQAEAAGMEYCPATGERDASGNVRLPDVSQFLKGALAAGLKQRGFKDTNIRIIVPSYMIRSVPPSIEDRQYCSFLATHAVHAAMAGYTGVTIGLVNNYYVLLPLMAMVSTRMDPGGRLWQRVVELTGQPGFEPPAKV
jgi:6-phosphofructokinase 1